MKSFVMLVIGLVCVTLGFFVGMSGRVEAQENLQAQIIVLNSKLLARDGELKMLRTLMDLIDQRIKVITYEGKLAETKLRSLQVQQAAQRKAAAEELEKAEEEKKKGNSKKSKKRR